MATIITPSNGSLKIAFTLDFGTKNYGFEKTIAFNSITQADKRIMKLPLGAETEIIGISSANMGRGIFDDFDLLILANMDDTNFVRIRMGKNAGKTWDYKLLAGQVLLFHSNQMDVNVNEDGFAAFEDADMISGQPDTAALDIEYVIIKI